jgi:hypothetical protein
VVVRAEVTPDANHEWARAWVDVSVANHTDTTFVQMTSSSCDIGFDLLDANLDVIGPYEQCFDGMGEIRIEPGDSIDRRLWWDGKVVVGTDRYEYLPAGRYFVAAGIQWGEIVVLGDTVAFDWRP